MPTPPPPKEKQFKKGQSGNPGGRKKMPEELRVISKLSKDEINALFAKYMRMSKTEMLAALQNESLSAIELWIASGIVSGIKNGDWHNLNCMLDRIFGKPKSTEEALLESQPHVTSKNPPACDDVEVETYVVMVNRNGKFEHARPKLLVT